MNTFTRGIASVLIASTALVAFATSPAAAETKAYLASPYVDPGFVPIPSLPTFGFSSFNTGFGERVSYVRWGGLASQLGLEPGDTILRMNGVPLNYTGSWNDALYNAMYSNGGWVSLRIRDVRTGYIVSRQMFLGGAGDGGPIVNHYKSNGSANNFSPPNGPVTLKSTIGPPNGNLSPKMVK